MVKQYIICKFLKQNWTYVFASIKIERIFKYVVSNWMSNSNIRFIKQYLFISIKLKRINNLPEWKRQAAVWESISYLKSVHRATV